MSPTFLPSCKDGEETGLGLGSRPLLSKPHTHIHIQAQIFLSSCKDGEGTRLGLRSRSLVSPHLTHHLPSGQFSLNGPQPFFNCQNCHEKLGHSNQKRDGVEVTTRMVKRPFRMKINQFVSQALVKSPILCISSISSPSFPLHCQSWQAWPLKLDICILSQFPSRPFLHYIICHLHYVMKGIIVGLCNQNR